MTEDRLIAQTILQQLGGRRFLVMTGAKNLLSGRQSLSMSLPGSMTHGRINKLTITLNGNDYYDVRAYKLKPSTGECPQVGATREDIDCENLRSVFTDITGLDTSL